MYMHYAFLSYKIASCIVPFFLYLCKNKNIMTTYRLIITTILLYIGMITCCADPLEKKLTKLTKDFKATVGVAVIKGNKPIVLLNNNVHYPLMSVFKFHVAVAVLHKMTRRQQALNDSLLILPEDIRENTYSPLREVVPHKRPFKLPFSTLLYYSIALSDNNACDILIKYVGGIIKIQALMNSIGLTHLQLTETENTMHENLMNCYNNWSTPLSMAQCLKKVYEGDLLNNANKQFLFNTMLVTSTGADKIKAGLPLSTPVAHKTGSSDRLPSGIMIGDNDVAIINPHSTHRYYLVVFIKNSRGSSQENHEIIAQISRIVYRHCSR